ncbi:hypothetical protein [Ectopseudomonas oleovorans]|nr:hypothetical protein [Pseudomonas oleovorans]
MSPFSRFSGLLLVAHTKVVAQQLYRVADNIYSAVGSRQSAGNWATW